MTPKQIEELRAEGREHILDNEKRIAALCIILGVNEIEVRFEGSGDSGCIDEVNFKGGIGFDPKTTDIEVWSMPSKRYDSTMEMPDGRVGGYVVTPGELTKTSLHQAVYEMVDHLTEFDECNVDWYNNEGGYGHWIMRPGQNVDFEVSYREIESEVGCAEFRKIGSEECASETWNDPTAPHAKPGLPEALHKARQALAGNSNDTEHDALVELVEALS